MGSEVWQRRHEKLSNIFGHMFFCLCRLRSQRFYPSSFSLFCFILLFSNFATVFAFNESN